MPPALDSLPSLRSRLFLGALLAFRGTLVAAQATDADGTEALATSRAFDGPLHLLITDVVMPGMNGKELADRLAQERSGLRVLYISGYADHAVVRHGVLEEGIAFLSKPFDLRELTRTVREVLDTGRVARPLASTAESGSSGDRG